MSEEQKHIDKFEIGYDSWYVYKDSDTSYTYRHFPDSILADEQYQITITHITDELGNEMYQFDAQEYSEVYGSGGWSKWTSYEDKVRDKVMEDAMKRIRESKPIDVDKVIEECGGIENIAKAIDKAEDDKKS